MSFLEDKILNNSSLKAFVENTIRVTKNLILNLGKIKEGMLISAFFSSASVFKKATLFGLSKVGLE